MRSDRSSDGAPSQSQPAAAKAGKRRSLMPPFLLNSAPRLESAKTRRCGQQEYRQKSFFSQPCVPWHFWVQHVPRPTRWRRSACPLPPGLRVPSSSSTQMLLQSARVVRRKFRLLACACRSARVSVSALGSQSRYHRFILLPCGSRWATREPGTGAETSFFRNIAFGIGKNRYAMLC